MFTWSLQVIEPCKWKCFLVDNDLLLEIKINLSLHDDNYLNV